MSSKVLCRGVCIAVALVAAQPAGATDAIECVTQENWACPAVLACRDVMEDPVEGADECFFEFLRLVDADLAQLCHPQLLKLIGGIRREFGRLPWYLPLINYCYQIDAWAAPLIRNVLRTPVDGNQ